MKAPIETILRAPNAQDLADARAEIEWLQHEVDCWRDAYRIASGQVHTLESKIRGLIYRFVTPKMVKEMLGDAAFSSRP